MPQDPKSALKGMALEEKNLKRQRDLLSRQIKLEERKRARRLERARGLSDADLMSIIAERAAARAAAAKAKAKAKAKGKDKSGR